MTKELLEQYPDICAEIEDLKAKDNAAVSDVVQASADEFPFNLHSVTVQGLPNPKHAERIRELKCKRRRSKRLWTGLPTALRSSPDVS